jgi:choloylglycine hydrolase
MYNSNIRCIDLKSIDFDKVKYQAEPLDRIKKEPIEMVSIK